MKAIKHLFDNNSAWTTKINKQDPAFFSGLAKQQSPEILWIGCSDSRVPPTQIMDLAPGDLFVHRNIANVIVHTDLNCLSVMQYAVEVLKVKHIIVCGHYGCGGVKAALEDQENGLIDNWLAHIKDVKRKHSDALRNLSADQKHHTLCELNVKEQVRNVCHTTIVQKAWKNDAELAVHGWIYNLEDGLLKDLEISETGV